MQRTFATRGLQSFLAMFFLVGGLFLITANRAEAQQTTLSAPANQSWKSSSAAMDVLVPAIQSFHQIMAQAPVGSNQYNNALAHAIYYKRIASLIAQGVSVGDAVTQARLGLSGVARTDDLLEGIHFTKSLLNALLADATALLS